MNSSQEAAGDNGYHLSPIFSKDAFSRCDETDDRIFYSTDRFVSHLDSLALSTVENLIGQLVMEPKPLILDLMAGWDSHIPKSLRPSKVVGLGLNKSELAKNEALTDIVLHDLNKNPILPLPDCTFHAVINTASVDYMTKPVQVFREVGRILRPGGKAILLTSEMELMKELIYQYRPVYMKRYLKIDLLGLRAYIYALDIMRF